MPTICSAIRKRDNTVGTSTNCSADCGSGIREREGHGEQEILGTSITCSAIGRSSPQRVLHVVHLLRYRKIKNLHERADGTEIFHVVPLQTSLPASDLRQKCWPVPAGLFFEAEELRPPGHHRARHKVRGHRGPCRLRSPQGGVLLVPSHQPLLEHRRKRC